MKKLLSCGRAFTLACSLMLLTAPAYAVGDSVEGKKVASQWCAACHLVTPGQSTATVAAPPFAEIKQRHEGKMEFLEAFLSQDHPNMPNMSLTYYEIQNLIAYIEGL